MTTKTNHTCQVVVDYEQTYDDCAACDGTGTVYRLRECRNSDRAYRSEENCTCCNGKGYTLGVRAVRRQIAA